MSEKILGNLSKGLTFVLSAPAGTGKTTLARMLIDEFSPAVALNISYTTRKPRHGEKPGHDYHFISTEEFKEKIEADEFLEYAEVFGYYYGSSKKQIEEMQNKGKHVLMVIDTQGVMQLKKKKFKAAYIFVSPPNLMELRERLFKRQTEGSNHIEERLSWAAKEIEMANYYDYNIINDNLHHAYDVLRSILIAEEHKNET